MRIFLTLIFNSAITTVALVGRGETIPISKPDAASLASPGKNGLEKKKDYAEVRKEWTEVAKNNAETLAFLGAALFFSYKAATGLWEVCPPAKLSQLWGSTKPSGQRSRTQRPVLVKRIGKRDILTLYRTPLPMRRPCPGIYAVGTVRGSTCCFWPSSRSETWRARRLERTEKALSSAKLLLDRVIYIAYLVIHGFALMGQE